MARGRAATTKAKGTTRSFPTGMHSVHDPLFIKIDRHQLLHHFMSHPLPSKLFVLSVAMQT